MDVDYVEYGKNVFIFSQGKISFVQNFTISLERPSLQLTNQTAFFCQSPTHSLRLTPSLMFSPLSTSLSLTFNANLREAMKTKEEGRGGERERVRERGCTQRVEEVYRLTPV